MGLLNDRLYEHYVTTHFGALRQLDPAAFESYRRHYAAVYMPLLPVHKEARILEIGCGLGHFLYFLKAAGFTNYSGIDIGVEQVDYCREHVTSQVAHVCDTASYLIERPGQYNSIVAIDVLEHLADDDLWRLLCAARDALVPGGKLIVSVPNAACVTALMVRYGDMTHRRLFTEGSLGQLCRTVGFVDIEMLPNEKKVVRSFRSRRAKWMWRLRERLSRWILAEFYEHLMEGAIPRVQTINLIGVARRSQEPVGQGAASDATIA